MRILLLCDKTAPALFSLAGELPAALLPLAGKCVAEYSLEWLCEQLRPAGLELYGGAYRNALRRQCGDGSRWGVALDYPESLPVSAELPVLVLSADRLCGFDVAAFVQQAARQPGRSMVARVDGLSVACWVARQEDWCEVLAGVWDWSSLPSLSCAGGVRLLDGLPAYYQASLELLRGGFPGLCLAAEGADEALVMEGRAWVKASAKVVGRAYVGTGSRIGEGAVLAGDCVIGPHVLVDNQARLENCVILPHSYVGRWVALRDAVVCGPHLWRMDTGASFRVEQRFLLSQLPAGGWLSRWLRGSWQGQALPV